MNKKEAADRIIDVELAADIAKVSVKTIRDALASGKLEGKNMGGSKGWMTTPTRVVEWVDRMIDEESKKRGANDEQA